MVNQRSLPPWIAKIKQTTERHGRRGGFLVSFPEYRPELVAVLAERLDLPLCDFRQEVMAPLGWQAAALPLGSLRDTVAARMDECGLVLNNAEALLAAKTNADRQAWFRNMLREQWKAPLILPVALFASDADDRSDRIITLGTDDLPESTLLTRLLATRFSNSSAKSRAGSGRVCADALWRRSAWF